MTARLSTTEMKAFRDSENSSSFLQKLIKPHGLHQQYNNGASDAVCAKQF